MLWPQKFGWVEKTEFFFSKTLLCGKVTYFNKKNNGIKKKNFSKILRERKKIYYSSEFNLFRLFKP